MATKTLGVKFEVVGLKSAVNSFKELKQGLNEVLAANKEYLDDSFDTIKSEKKREEATRKANLNIFFSYLRLRKQIKEQTDNIYKDTKRNLSIAKQSITDYYKFNFGSKVQRQQVIIKEEKKDFSQRQTFRNLDKNSRNQVLEQRLIFRELLLDLKKIINEDLRDVIKESVSEANTANSSFTENIANFIKYPLGAAMDAAIFPFQSMVAGAFERIGEVQTEDFSRGFSQKLQKSLGLSFKDVGGDVGDIFGEGIYRVYDSVLKNTKKAILSDLDDKTPEIKSFINDLKNIFIGSIIKGAAVPVKAHKRIQLNKVAMNKTLEQAGELLLNQEVSKEDRAKIEKANSISLIIGGVNMDSEARNTEFVERILTEYLEDTFIVPIKNFWSNSKLGEEYKLIINKIVKNLLKSPLLSGNIDSFLKERGLADAMKKFDDGSEINIDRLADEIIDLMEKRDIPLIKLLETAFEGYNTDDVMIAAQAMFYKEQFPDKPINIIGTSAGGHNAAGSLEMLNKAGYTDIKAAGITTPITGLEFTGNEEDYLASIGTKDFLYKGIYEGLLKDFIIPPSILQVIEDAGQGHLLPLFIAEPKFQARFLEFFKGRLNIKKGVDSGTMGYITRKVQNPEDENLQRTLLKLMGENPDDGYTFGLSDLKGFTREIKKKAKRVSNKDIAKEAKTFIDFLDTLIEELEIIEVVGQEVKPFKSLEKAKKLYPNLKDIPGGENSLDNKAKENILIQAKENKNFIAFKQKLAQESGNIERTLKSINGEKIEGYSFYDKNEYEVRATEHLGGLIKYLENDLLKNASTKEKAKSFKYLSYLKKLQEKIISYGETGKIDSSFLEEGKEFLRASDQNGRIDRPQNSPKTKRHYNQANDASQNISFSGASSSSLNNAYQNYLERIVLSAQKAATKFLEEGGDITSQDKEFAYNSIRKKVARYRQAFKELNIALAMDLGEQLIEETEYFKQLFQQAGDDPNKGQKIAQLTRVQNEVISGDKGKGRVATPLSELGSQPGFRQLALDFSDIGSQLEAGLSEGTSGYEFGQQFARDVTQGSEDEFEINSPSRVFETIGKWVRAGFEIGASGDQVGSDFATDVIDSVKKGLGINSPSTLFEWIGTMAVAGWDLATQGIFDGLIDQAANRLDRLRNMFAEPTEVNTISDAVTESAEDLNESPSWIDYIFGTEGADETLNNFFGSITEKVLGFYDSLKENFPILQRIEDVVIDIGGELFQFLGLAGLSDFLIQFGSTALETAMQIESLERSLASVSSSAEAGARNIAFIRKEAKNLSIDLPSAMEAYTRIVGATRNTSLEGLQTEKIFKTLATTAKNRGLSGDATSRLFLGFEQVIAKNEFKSEEVRGQLAEVLGDIQNLLASSAGVPISQLSSLMEAGVLKAPEYMPKLMALLDAQNAAMGESNSTAQASLTRFNNAMTDLRDSVGSVLQPLQKLNLDLLAASLEVLTSSAKELIHLVANVIVTILINLGLRLLSTKIIIGNLSDLIFTLGFRLGALFSKILAFMTRFILVFAAVEIWLNNIKLAQNAFPELDKRVTESTNRLNALADAFNNSAIAAQNYSDSSQLQLNEGWKLPDNGFGNFLRPIVGGDYLNWDNLVRNRLNSLYSFYGDNKLGSFLRFGPIGLFKKNKPTTTQAQKKQADFVEGASDLMANTDSTLSYGQKVRLVLPEIDELDKQIRKIQSDRYTISSGDDKALQKSLALEKKLLEQRDSLVKKSAQYQESLQGEIQAIEQTLAELTSLDLTGGTEEEKAQRENTRKALLERLAALKGEKEAIDAINARIPKFLSAIDSLLRSSKERVTGFIDNQESNAVTAKTEATVKALMEGWSDGELKVAIDNISINDLGDRINLLSKEIGSLESKLSTDEIKEGIAGLENRARHDGLELTNPTIERLIEQGGSAQELKAANLLLQIDEYQGMLAESKQGLVDLLKEQKSSLSYLNRTIQDYFFNLIQQIKEAQLEAKTLLSQILGSKIKNKLKAALIPGSDSFVNGLIEGIQGLLDQAQTLIEQTLGLEGNKIQLESSNYSLDKEMQDFIKSVSGATDALSRFRESLGMVGGGGDSSNNQPIGNNSSIVDSLRRAIIGKESAGKFNAVNPDSGALGYGQVMPANVPSWTKAALGKSLSVDEFLNNPDAQIKVINHKLNEYLTKELKATGNNLDVAVRRVASTWYSGQPNLYNNTRPQYYNSASYPSINDYTADILTRFKNDAGVNVEDAMPGETPGISAVRSVNNQGLSDRSNNAQAVTDALVLTNRLKADKNLNAYLQEQKNAQDKIGFDLQLQQQLQQQERQFIANQRESERTLFGISDRLFEFGNQGKLQTANTELEQGIRSLVGQFRDYRVELTGIKQTYQDSVQMLTNATQRFPEAISIAEEQVEMLRSAGQFEAASAAIKQVKILEESLRQANQALPYYQQELSKIEAQEKRLPDLEKKAIAFYRRQGEIKLDAERISKNSAIAQLKVNIANERGTNELRRQNDLLAEQWRLSSEINRIRSEHGDTPYADELIKLEEEQSKINVENINRGAYDRDLSYEQKLLDLDAGVKNTRGGLLSGFGDLLGGNKLQREAAIAQENFRFYKELIDLRREYSAEPEKLDILINKATELNQVNLEQIKQQFKGLKDTLIDLGRTNLGTFFESAMEGIFNRGEKQRELKEQELQYREELIEVENKYQDNSSGLDFARDRIKKLNEEKLDKIRNELNLFNTVVNAARTAVINLLKEIARMAMQKLAANIIGSIFGGIGGGMAGSGATTSMNFDGGAAAFTASEGITVPKAEGIGLRAEGNAFNSSIGNFKFGGNPTSAVSLQPSAFKKRIVSKNLSNYLRSTSPVIDDAFSREGSSGVLGVFTPGEEILSIKTGEAGRYQALKQKLGLDPLKKVFAGNFATGGTVDIEKNLLARLPSISTPVNLTGVGNQKSNIPTSVQNITNFSATVVTPNADSFRASSYQTQQDIAEALLRARR